METCMGKMLERLGVERGIIAGGRKKILGGEGDGEAWMKELEELRGVKEKRGRKIDCVEGVSR